MPLRLATKTFYEKPALGLTFNFKSSADHLRILFS